MGTKYGLKDLQVLVATAEALGGAPIGGLRNTMESMHHAERCFGPINTLDKLRLLKRVCVKIGRFAAPSARYETEQAKADFEAISELNLTEAELADVLAGERFTANEGGAAWRAQAVDRGFVWTADGRFTKAYWVEDCEYADTKGQRYSFNFRSVAVRNDPGIIDHVVLWTHEHAMEYAMQCAASTYWFDTNYFTFGETNSGDRICGAWALQRGWYFQRNDRRINDDDDDDDDEYDHDEDEGEGEGDWSNGVFIRAVQGRAVDIPSYHSQPRWDMSLANQSTRAFYGLEIELLFESGAQRFDFWNNNIKSLKEHFLGETDGSLDRQRAMEIITRPFSMEELNDPAGAFKWLCDKLVAIKARAPAGGNYGVHVNTNWGRLNPDHRARLRHFIVTTQKMTEYIAGRGPNQYAQYSLTTGKYSVAHYRNDNVGEIRCFQASPHYERLMSYVEYVEAVTQWTLDPNRLVAGPLAASLFRHWVGINSQLFPHLASRFSAPTQKDTTCASLLQNQTRDPSMKRRSGAASAGTATGLGTLLSPLRAGLGQVKWKLPERALPLPLQPPSMSVEEIEFLRARIPTLVNLPNLSSLSLIRRPHTDIMGTTTAAGQEIITQILAS